MDYPQAEAYLLGTIDESTSRHEPYRLDRIRTFLRALGDPQNCYPTIHIGGTSGKGSTSTMVAAMLRTAGKRTGLHTKPHLHSMTERAVVDGDAIGEERFAELLEEMMPVIERCASDGVRPSYYETLLALAFLHFARERVDIAVIEVGIGGSLDGTNVIVPLVSAITTVGYDHTEILGDTLELIAADKAGIAKPGVPLICGVLDAGPREVIAARCAVAGAPFVPVWESTSIEARDGTRFAVRTPETTYEIAMPLLGAFQRHNAAIALRIVEVLPASLRPSREEAQAGLASATLAGRMEYFAGPPAVVFDVAHNPEKAGRLVDALREQFPDARFAFVVGIGDSKNASAIVRALAPVATRFAFSRFEAPGRHATEPEALAAMARDLGRPARTFDDPMAAFAATCNDAPEEIIVVTGSTLMVASVRPRLKQHVAG